MLGASVQTKRSSESDDLSQATRKDLILLMPKAKKRATHARTERAGLIAVEAACNKLDLIWRDVLQEDVGVDGTIEIALGDFPTGKLVGAQVKSGISYIRSESVDAFRFYPDSSDVDYWRNLSIPLFLLVHNPTDGNVYWVDVSKYVEERANDPLGRPYIEFSKKRLLDSEFAAYLRARFDLVVYDDAQFTVVRHQLDAIRHSDTSGVPPVTISALALFIEGLWGLCTKLQFHSSLLSELIRKRVLEQVASVHVTYTFDRASLYPFFTKYFNALSEYHLASIDVADINHSLYAKLEFPTFIAPLTTNGRLFVEYLRRQGVGNAHDNQHLTLSLTPHVQIEVYESFSLVEGRPRFGPYTDVLAISFNGYLDYYRVMHLRRSAAGEPVVRVAEQNIYYHELQEYIAHNFDSVNKDNLMFRYQDVPLSPLICWLEKWNDNPQSMPPHHLAGKTNTERAGFHDELVAIVSPAGSMTVREPTMPPFPIRLLTNGEHLPEAALKARAHR